MNKEHELKMLESEIYGAKMNQDLKAERARMRMTRLESYRVTVSLLLNDVDDLDDSVVQVICDQMRGKIKDLDL